MIITKHEQFVQRIQKQYGHIIDLFQINKETLGVITNKSKCYIYYNPYLYNLKIKVRIFIFLKTIHSGLLVIDLPHEWENPREISKNSMIIARKY